MRLAGILALTLVHGEAEDNATCVDLLTLPREDSSSQCYRGDCSCHLAVEEVVWQVLRPLEDGSAGLEYHSRTLTPTLGAWMDQAAAFLEGGEPLDAGFRAMWLELAVHPSALCQRAQTLLTQLWSVLAALAACFAAEVPDAGAGQSALCLEKLRITQALAHDHGGVWSRPFWLPLGNPLKDAAEFAVASRASSATRWQRVSPELMRNAYLDFNAIITALFKEVWTDEQTWLQQMEESYSAPASDGCDFTFYAVASLERLQAAAEYLASHQWSCFLTGGWSRTWTASSSSMALRCASA
ncbi:unnamed protein product [Effrenium voratum]|uniref:Uncharacterized protein n=1 Tax=Effrenium voratum TaxID=2562239 RepID=A0AA36NAF1_9DINO|nr:unnamed protein product [Effrenium voratum]